MPSWIRVTVLPMDRNCSTSSWFSGKNVCPSTLVLDFRWIRRSLDDLSNYEPCRLEKTLDFRWLKEEKIHCDWMAPQFLLVSGTFTHVECEEKVPVRVEHSIHFAKNQGQKFIRTIHDGVEGGDAGEGFVGEIQSHHVALAETDVRVQPSSLL